MRRSIRIAAGFVLAIIGTVILVTVVNNQSSTTTSPVVNLGPVVIVKSAIPRQTPIELIGGSIAVVQIPANLIAPGAVASLDEITAGFVASTELLPGEQLFVARFTSPQSLARIKVPGSLQEVTIPVVPERAIGGAFIPGDTLGVIASFETGTGGQNTSFILHGALVTAIQYSAADLSAADGSVSGSETSARTAPTNQLLITFAVSSLDAARLVFAAEFGSIWLSLEGPTANVGGEGIITFERLQAPR